jgi:mannose-1-phosphate guanylyltransferase
LGSRPTARTRAYGYIEADRGGSFLLGVKRFVEKPSPAAAEAYVDAGAF